MASKPKGGRRPPGNLKRGPLSAGEKQVVDRWIGRKTAEEVAALIRRPAVAVINYLNRRAEAAPPDVRVTYADIEERPEWANFKLQFDADELKFLKYRYVQLMNQFGKDDVLPTEEMQIFELIKAELHGNQVLSERRTLVTQQKRLQVRLERLYGELEVLDPKSGDGRTAKQDADELEAAFAAITRQLKDIAAREQGYSTLKANLLQTLKATRDQRVKVVEGSKQSFLGFLRALQVEDFRSSESRDAEMMRVAMEREKVRLSAPHLYADGATDQPLLTPETVLDSYTPPDVGVGGGDAGRSP